MNETAKTDVKRYWENEVCGTRNRALGGLARVTPVGVHAHDERATDIERYEQNRAAFEPFIGPFADYGRYAGRDVLEIGVGGGADYVKFLRAGARIAGIDLTEAAVNFVRARLEDMGLKGDVRVADAENLPFADAAFDLVYSYGVLHHSPDTARALAEAYRVLRPGGELKAMVYSDFSMAGLMLWVVHGLLKGRPFRSQRDILFHHLESPGTKCYGAGEFKVMLEKIGFRVASLHKKAGAGDLLHMEASAKYSSGAKKVLFALGRALLPRGLIRRHEDRLGLFLLAVAIKPGL